MKRIPIERRNQLSPDLFYKEYLEGCGKPVVVTDALQAWPALSKWTFDFLKSRYADETVAPASELSSPYIRVMKFGEFIDYLKAPTSRPPGFWIDKATRKPLRDLPEPASAPLYLFGWDGFQKYPELLDDIQPSPYFVDDWLPLLRPAFRQALRQTPFRDVWILVGPAGTISRLHYDFLHTHAYLAQIVGRKKCFLFAPDEADLIYYGGIDPDQPDFDQFPLSRGATAYEAVLQPGEVLFIPSRWWHAVTALDHSITVSYNFFNRVNFGDYFLDFFRSLPRTLRHLERTPGWHEALGVNWTSKGFESLEMRPAEKDYWLRDKNGE